MTGIRKFTFFAGYFTRLQITALLFLILLAMASIKTFEELKVWQKARLFCKEIFTLITKTELSKDHKLKEQVNSSSGSIMDNISEGFGRGANTEFIRFLEISHASACESQSQLYRILDRGYIVEQRFKYLYEMAEEIKKMLISLVNYLSKSLMNERPQI
jgi:four helix bundle protein